MTKAEWVAVDWGTSNVRAWGIASDGSQVFAVGADKGMGKIGRADYPSVLADLIGERVEGTVDVVVCGMAGARQGWLDIRMRLDLFDDHDRVLDRRAAADPDLQAEREAALDEFFTEYGFTA